MSDSKPCSKCLEIKSMDYFARDKNKSDGLCRWCRECTSEYQRGYREKNKAELREYHALRYSKNREVLKAAARDGYRRNPYIQRNNYLLRTYRVNLDTYMKMLNQQGYSCANTKCGAVFSLDSKMFAVDHDHGCCPGERSCGVCVRGILCGRCNSSLGLVDDDLEKLQGLVEYLKKWEGKK